MRYVQTDVNGKPIAKVTRREYVIGQYTCVWGKVLQRIEGPRSAWDHIPILWGRDSGKGQLVVREISWYEDADGKVVRSSAC